MVRQDSPVSFHLLSRGRSVAQKSALGCAAVLVGSMLFAPLPAAQADESSEPFVLGDDGTTSVQYSYINAIREYAYVPVTDADGQPQDSDGDGKQDFTRVDIIRPSELDARAQAGDEGAKVSSIMDASPYYGIKGYGRGLENEYKKYYHPNDPEHSVLAQFPQYYDNYFVPRGYAYVLTDDPGTNLSDGCGDGAGPIAVAAHRSVIDWMNGRAKAYTDKDVNSEEVGSYWSNGKVGVFGKSHDGALANGLGATGVEGLKTVVPISGAANNYGQTSPYGVQKYGGNWIFLGTEGDAGWSYKGQTNAGDCQSVNDAIQAGSGYGDERSYNEWWSKRNYLPSNNPQFKASVFIVHSVNDLNVWTYAIEDYWEDVKDAGLDAKMWLSQGGHDDPFDFRREAWVSTIHRWFDNQLYDIDNGVDSEPAVSVEGEPEEWTDYADWPARGATETTYSLKSGLALDGTVGSLSLESPGVGEASFQGGSLNSEGDGKTYALDAGGNTGIRAKRLLYVSDPLQEDTHVSGIPKASLSVKGTQGDTNLAFLLVDYGDSTYVKADASSLHAWEFKETTSCYGLTSPDNQFNDVWDSAQGHNQIVPGDDGCYNDAYPLTLHSDAHVIGRGIVGTAHKDSLETKTSAPVDEYYPIEITGMMSDWTVKAGHRLGVILTNNLDIAAGVSSSDFTVDLSRSSVSIPLAAVEEPVSSEVDKAQLRVAYDAAKSVGAVGYEEGSWSAFENARSAANTVLNDPDATQAEVDSALGALRAAQAGLESVADTLAVRRGNAYYLNRSTHGGAADRVVYYGRPSDQVLVGDWDGDGVDTLAVRRGNRYYIKNSLSGGAAETVIAYGNPGDSVLVGDWDGDGVDTLAVRRGSTYYLKDSLSGGEADRVVAYGSPSDTVLVGDWKGDGMDSLAVRRGSTYYLSYTIHGGEADRVVAFGKATDQVLAGRWFK